MKVNRQSTPLTETKRSAAQPVLTDDNSFAGVAAVYGRVDQDGDIIQAGAFADSLAAGLPRLLWQHDPSAPVGSIIRISDQAGGLRIEAKLASSGRGKEAYDLLKLKALNGLSVGFVTREASRDPNTGVRTITRADLAEISLVTFPAHPEARVDVVKAQAAPVAPATLEKALRGAGLSRKQAKQVLATGFGGLDMADPVDPTAGATGTTDARVAGLIAGLAADLAGARLRLSAALRKTG